jgi:hypothetical protein
MVTDLSGKTLKQSAVTGNKSEVSMTGLASGIYLVKYQDDNRTETIRITRK